MVHQPSGPGETVPELRLQINAYDFDELSELAGPNGTIEKAEDKPPGAHGEPITVAVVLVTPLIVQAMSAWLLKKRRRKSVEVRAEKVYPDGTREIFVVNVNVNESSTEADVVKQVVDGFKLDPELISSVAALGG